MPNLKMLCSSNMVAITSVVRLGSVAGATHALWQSVYRALLRCYLRFCLIFLLAFVSLNGFAQASPASLDADGVCVNVKVDPARLTLEAALRSAMFREPQILSAAARIEAESARRGAARSGYYPTISAGAQRTYTHSKTVGLFGSTSEAIGNTANLQWSILLLDFGGRAAQNRSAARLVHAAIATKDGVLLNVFSNVIKSYFSIIRADQLIEAASEAERNAQLAVTYAKTQVDLGALAVYETKLAESSLAQARLTRVRTTTQRLSANAELATLIGLSANLNLKLAPSNPDLAIADKLLREGTPAVKAALAKALATHSTVVVAAERLAAASAQVQVAKSAYFPTVTLSGQHYLNGRPQTSPSTPGSREHVVTASLSIPLFDGFSTTYRNREVEAQEDEAAAELDRARAFVQLEVWKAYGVAKQQIEVVRSSELLVTVARDTLDAAEVRRGNGSIDTIEWLRAQRSYFDARAEVITARSELILAKASLLTALGALDMGAPSEARAKHQADFTARKSLPNPKPDSSTPVAVQQP